MKIVRVVRNYLSSDKCDELNDWVADAIKTGKIGFGITTDQHYLSSHRVTSNTRYTSRMYASNYIYPELVRELHTQIEADFSLEKWHLPKHSHGRDGVVVSATLNGGDVYLHKDPKDGHVNKEVLRCNILTSETEGGLIWVGEQAYTLRKGDMMQYLVSRHEHSVEPVVAPEGDYRIMWMFGWYVDGDEWEASIQDNNNEKEHLDE